MDVGGLAEQVAAWEYATTVPELSSRQRQRVYVSLVQTHLPRMESEGVVVVEDSTVSLTDEAAELDVYLEIVPEDDIEWPQYYLGVSMLNVGLLGLGLLDVPVLGRAPDALWVLAVAAVFLFAALVHGWYHRRSRLGTNGPPPS